jgi:uncharacterized protein YukE
VARQFKTDPDHMRAMAGLFDVYAQTVQDEALKMRASSQNDTMGQMNQAFRNIVNMLHGVRDDLIRDANDHEQQEQASLQILST